MVTAARTEKGAAETKRVAGHQEEEAVTANSSSENVGQLLVVARIVAAIADRTREEAATVTREKRS